MLATDPYKNTPVIIALALFLETIDTTVLNTAIPSIAHNFKVDPVDLKVALISYLISLAIFVPISGWLADKFGAKKIFIIALGIFTLSSLWCGFAHNLITLITARFVQGIGGALGLPVGRLIIVRTFPRNLYINMMNRVVTVGALGMMLGPVIGGLITHYWSWQWIFWINVPVGLFGIILAALNLKNIPPVTVPPLDKLGFMLFGLSLTGLVFGLSALSESMMDLSLSLLSISASIALMIGYFAHSRQRLHPIVNIQLFQIRTFQVSTVGNLISRLGFGGIPFLFPLLLQINLHFSPQLSGLMLAPVALGVLLAKTILLPLVRALGYKRLLITNTFLAGFNIFLFSIIGPNTPLTLIATLTFSFGLIMSLQYSCMNSLGIADLPAEHFSAATSIISTLQQLSQSLGVAISAVLIRVFVSLLDKPLYSTPEVIYYTFYALALITMLSAFIFLRLHQEDGAEMLLR